MSRLLLKGFRKDRRSSQLGSIQKSSILIPLACCFIILVTFLAGFALNRVQARIKTDVAEALEIVLQTTQESLNMWVENGKFQINQLAGETRLASMVERQLEVPRNKTDLLKSRFDEDLRKAGLIAGGQKSILAVSVRDPGGDMTKGFSPSVPRYQQPLTIMPSRQQREKPV